jgi:hypothetical protein
LNNFSKFISWTELSDKFKLQDIEILEYLKMGLTIYSRNGTPVACPWKFHRRNFLQKEQNEILKPSVIENFLPEEREKDKNILPNHSIENYENAKTKALEKLSDGGKEKFLRIEKEFLDIKNDDPDDSSWKYFYREPG